MSGALCHLSGSRHGGTQPELLGFGASRGLIADLLARLPVDASLQAALQKIEEAARTMSSDPALQQLLSDVGQLLSQLIPETAADPFTIGITAATDRDLLGQFELLLTTEALPIPVPKQSSGMTQLAVFVFALRLLTEFPGAILAVDEPEISLQPHAQRALVALLEASASQTLIATHSSNVLDGVDPRRVVRLHRHGENLEGARPTNLSDAEAARLARLSTPSSAEAFFARKVVMVEGISDVLAVRRFASPRKCGVVWIGSHGAASATAGAMAAAMAVATAASSRRRLTGSPSLSVGRQPTTRSAVCRDAVPAYLLR
jgi:hypothetical protein